MFEKGQSKRIWGELYKVIDSSDIVIEVLDARNPLGTRSKKVEEVVKGFGPHKHLIFVLNKCDLVPTWVTRKWVRILSQYHPTLAFHASVDHPFGKGALIQLLRQFTRLHTDKKQICVGFIGYPNVGKSSVINTLRKKKVCKVAPIPGETKVWQYITLYRKIYLIDCPGVVSASKDTETDVVLKGVVRIENLEDPVEHIDTVLTKVKKEYLVRTYGIQEWEDHVDFLKKFALKSGKLLKKGEPDIKTAAKMILYDWTRGRLPFFYPPPKEMCGEEDENEQVDEEDEVDEAIVTAVPVVSEALSVSIDDPGAASSSSASSSSTERQRSIIDPMTVQISVKQKFSKLKVASVWEGTTDQFDPEKGGYGSDDEISEDDDAEEEEVDYDELLGAVEGDTVSSMGGNRSDDDDADDSDDSGLDDFIQQELGLTFPANEDPLSDTESKQTKSKRMTTNKKKIGSHFYDTANVKNRNRDRKTPKNTNSRSSAKRPRAR